jgi:hypothetical protein
LLIVKKSSKPPIPLLEFDMIVPLHRGNTLTAERTVCRFFPDRSNSYLKEN